MATGADRKPEAANDDDDDDDDLLVVVEDEGNPTPKTTEALVDWLKKMLANYPLGLRPSELVYHFFQEFQEPMLVPLPEYVKDTEESEESDETYFVHSAHVAVRDPLVTVLSSIDGLTYEHDSNKFILGDQHELLRIRMKIAVAQIADGAEITMGHWTRLFRKLDRDGSGKLDRREFYAFVREYMALPGKDYPDEALWEVFMALDDDGSNLISTEELIAFAEGRSESFK
jgi:hypothetical protein